MIQRLSQIDFVLSKTIASVLSYDGWARKFFQAITLTGTAVAWLIGLPILYILLPSFRQEAYSMFGVTLIMTAVVMVLKILIKRQRPVFKDDRYLSVSFDVFSFPSGHATRSAYVAILMPIYTPEWTIFWYIWALIMIISRLVLGVHYISDILAGLFLGGIAMLILFIIGWFPYLPFSELLEG